jgi:flagellar biosynthesis/type III secretory pathway chaperone
MSQETQLLQALQIKEFSALQDRKASLVEAYENQTKALRADPGFAAEIDPRLRAELKDVAERMQAVMAKNDIAIKAARELNQRVATAIVDAVTLSKPGSSVYSSRGGYQETKNAPPVSVQIDGHF